MRNAFLSLAMMLMASGSAFAGIDCQQLDRKKVAGIIGSWTKAGVIVDDTAGFVVVDENMWKATNEDVKVSIAVAEFCRLHPDSKGSVTVKGSVDHTILGQVVDGEWTQ